MLFKIGDNVRLKTIEEFEETNGPSSFFHKDPKHAKYFGKSCVVIEDLTYMYSKPIYRVKFLEYSEALIVSRRWLVLEGRYGHSDEIKEALIEKIYEGNEIMEGLEDEKI
jgi:hypothetical protein